ncbi:hypothetical protein K402DRAFT_393105 [Aulographum hederae CBS 113979]|uniref:Transmembrane protein 135 N-terminal domain-containing protein n=1 Tax=Aulographum hederae CBS 113979 TaxID=1176131 RepID=A0A6G1H1L9_9PEZI|nr:hypothetical protein K402DRAFT_393105 [Aulographum hederae CBS 113979]
MSSAGAPPSSASSTGSNDKIDPVLRNALRYTVSAKEYKLLHRYLISRAPPAVKKRTPQPPRYEAIVKSKDDYNAAAIRASFRVFASTYAALKLWDLIQEKLLTRGAVKVPQSKTPIYKSANFRLSSSLSFILLFHRLFFRFLTRLRATLLTQNAVPFRRRNPRVAAALTSPLSPAVGAALAGSFLGVVPKSQLRITIAIYTFSRALEFAYNALEEKGWFKNRPWWFGSWMLMPVSCGQLLHAFVYDRDCFPSTYGNFILKNSPEYIQQRPADYPSHLKWPGTYEICDSLAEISKLRWPAFTSPILFPALKQTLPTSLTRITPITSPAHPSITSLSCALLHPHDPSCARVYLTYYAHAFPSLARFFALIYSAFAILRWRSFAKAPVTALNKLAKQILSMTMFISGAIGTSWGALCLFQQLFSGRFLPTQRFFFAGFLGGMWGFLERKKGRSNFLYSWRMSLDSLWKVGVKRGWWKGVANGDVLLFVASLAVVGGVYEGVPRAVSSGVARKGLGLMRGEGWVDRVAGGGDGQGVEALGEREKKATGADVDEKKMD